jgi:hypothetical protein
VFGGPLASVEDATYHASNRSSMDIVRTGTEFDLDGFLGQPLMAHLATGSEGGPRESPVWFLWEQGYLWFVGTSHDSWIKRLRADARCAVGIVEFDLPHGVLRHVGMRGTTEVNQIDRALLSRLLAKYIGTESEWNSAFRASVIDNLDLMLRFTPESVVANDQSYFSTSPG